jgi:hypothetical protein
VGRRRVHYGLCDMGPVNEGSRWKRQTRAGSVTSNGRGVVNVEVEVEVNMCSVWFASIRSPRWRRRGWVCNRPERKPDVQGLVD